MPSSYSQNLGMELIATGEKGGVWGNVTNHNLEWLDDSIDGYVDIILGSDKYTITTSPGADVPEGRKKVLRFTGSLGQDCTVTIAPASAQKLYFVINNTKGVGNDPNPATWKALIFTQGSGPPYRLEPGCANIISCDGRGANATVIGVLKNLSLESLRVDGPITLNGAVTATSLSVTSNASVGGTLNVTGASTLTGNVTMSGTCSVTGALTGSTATLSGRLDVGTDAKINGGIHVVGGATFSSLITAAGNIALTVGGDALYDMWYRGSTGNFARLAAGANGSYLRAGAAGVPQWVASEIKLGTAMPGAVQGCLLFPWNGVLSQETNLYFDASNYRLGIGTNAPQYQVHVRAPGTHARFALDGEGYYHRSVEFMAGGANRFSFGVQADDPSVSESQYFSIVRWLDDGTPINSFLINRFTGKSLIGLATDLGGGTNILGLGATNISFPPPRPPVTLPLQPALAVGNNPAYTGAIQIWMDNQFRQVASILNDGSFTGKLSLTSVTMTKIARGTAAANGPSDVNKGSLMFVGDVGAYNANNYLAFRYGTGTSWASVFLMLPALGAGGQQTNMTWAANYGTNSVVLFAGREGEEPPSYEEAQSMNDATTLERILSRPELVARLKEALK